jgi:hypothetical protein
MKIVLASFDDITEAIAQSQHTHQELEWPSTLAFGLPC